VPDHIHFSNIVLLVVIVLLLRSQLRRWWRRLREHWRGHQPRRWKPASPHDCMLCCGQVSLGVVKQREVVPYSQTKSPRGRKKSIATRGYACPHPHCAFCGITDDAIHALVGYGHHNHIQRFRCQACRKVFTSRIGTPLYYLKTSPDRIERVLWFLAEGVDVPVMVRFTGCGDATIARWLERMGSHSQTWHNRLFRDLVFTILQLDELYTRVYPSSTSTPPTNRDEFVHLLTVLHPQAERALSHAISCNNSPPSTGEMAAAGRQRGVKPDDTTCRSGQVQIDQTRCGSTRCIHACAASLRLAGCGWRLGAADGNS
jgi:transposase-like protein